MQYRVGQKFTIGQAHANDYSYDEVTGLVATYVEPKQGYARCHRVGTDKGIWYVHEEDMHPIGSNNEELAYLLLEEE